MRQSAILRAPKCPACQGGLSTWTTSNYLPVLCIAGECNSSPVTGPNATACQWSRGQPAQCDQHWPGGHCGACPFVCSCAAYWAQPVGATFTMQLYVGCYTVREFAFTHFIWVSLCATRILLLQNGRGDSVTGRTPGQMAVSSLLAMLNPPCKIRFEAPVWRKPVTTIGVPGRGLPINCCWRAFSPAATPCSHHIDFGFVLMAKLTC